MTTLLAPFLDRRSRRAFAAAHGAWWRDWGVRLVVADEDVDDVDRALFDGVLTVPRYDRLDEVTAALEAFAAATQVDGVLAQSEYGLLPASLVCRRLGCPGPSPEAAFACTHKGESRRRLAAANVPVPGFARASDAAGVLRFAAERGFPVILKGMASTMARNVVRVDRPEDVPAAASRLRAALADSPDVRRLADFARKAGFDLGCDPRRDFLVEECVDGVPAETDGIVRAGVPWTFGVIEQRWTAPPLFYLEGYLLPVDPEVADAARVAAAGEAAVAASGLVDGGFAVEFRARGGDDVRVIEVNGRLGEDDGFGRLFETAIGVEPWRECVKALAGLPGGDRDGAYAGAAARPSALAYACGFREGIVRRVPAAAEREAARGGCVEVQAAVEEGTRMFAPPHPDVFPHLAWALASHPAGSRAAYAEARRAVDALRFRME